VAPTAKQVLEAVKASGVKYVLEDGWDNPAVGKYGSGWKPAGVVLHHTANGGAKGNTPSLRWVLHNEYAPVRACHFLVGRDGTVHVVYALGCYHAGRGGPMRVGGVSIPKDEGNRYLYGIEVESKGTKAHVDAGPDDVDGFTPAQVAATTALSAELVRMLGKDESAVIRHRDWAPGRKTDVLQPVGFWRLLIKDRLKPKPVPAPAPAPKPPVQRPAPVPRTVAKILHLQLLKPGLPRSADVKAYQTALRSLAAKLGVNVNKINPSGATGLYRTETAALTKAVYLALGKRLGPAWVRGDLSVPGPSLLKQLGYTPK
jgi:hypothetical protein